MQRKRNVRRCVMAIGLLGAVGSAAVAGPNLIAIGNYGEVPFKRAEGRDSFVGKEIVYSFDDPEFDFGRVVVRSAEPLSKVRRDLFVGFSGEALVVDTRGGGGSGGGTVRIEELEIWLKVRGRIRPERSYEWEIEVVGSDREIRAFPAIIPAFWADGKPFGSDVIIRQPDDPESEAGDHGDDRIRRLEFPHGLVKVPSFERQTGAAWVVLKPQDFGGVIGVSRFAFREVEENLAQDLKAGNPTPVRYIAIRSVLEDEIAAALEQSATELKRLQNPDHFWQGENAEGSVGVTALVVAALAESDPSAEGLKEAMDWLARQEPERNQTWSFSTRAQRLYTLSRYGGLDEYRSAISSDAKALTDAQLDDGGWASTQETAGGTTSGPLRPRPDNGTSETALWALAEARFAGLEPDGRIWRKAMQYWTEAQAFDGGFREKLERYGGVGQATTSAYTALGAASLVRSLDMAAGVDGKRCNAYLASKVQLRAITSALEWLDKNYREPFKDAGSLVRPADLYLEGYALQVLGSVSGIARFHDKDHFDETARSLLSMRDPGTGLFGWRDPQSGQWVQPPNFLRTAQAMFILASGAGPIACQRIIVGDDEARSNEFNNDVAHLARYLSKARKRQFGWRRTTIDREVRELAEVPFLFVNVVGPMNWGKPEWEKIREYCLNGGTAVLNLNEDQEAERAALLDGIKTTFPEYSLGDLDENHPVFSAEKKLEVKPKLQALGNGIRDFLFVPAESWSCRWHLFERGEKDESLQFMNNLLTYGTDSAPLHSSFVVSTYAAGAASTLSMRAAHLEVGGKLPAYPSLISALDRLMQANYRIRVEPAADLAAADVVWVSVTGDAPPSEAVLGQLRSALSGGKYLFVDVVTGNKSWDEAFQAVLKSLGPKVVLENLRRNHPVYTGEVPGTQGFDVVDVAFRKTLHEKKTTRGRAELYAILVDGRQAGVFSAHDLSSGIGYHQFPNCRGPMPEDSRRVVMNVFLDAYQRRQMAQAGR